MRRVFAVIGVFLMLFIIPLLGGCDKGFSSNSEVYECYYYTSNGEDLMDKIVYYTIELKPNGKMITRNKTLKNKKTGKDNYYIDGDKLVITSFSTRKEFDIVANEIIMVDRVSSNNVVAKFRLIQTAKGYDFETYCFVERLSGDTDLSDSLRYFLLTFSKNNTANIFFRGATAKVSASGQYDLTPSGYYITLDKENDVFKSELFFDFDPLDENKIILTETVEGASVITVFEKTLDFNAFERE